VDEKQRRERRRDVWFVKRVKRFVQTEYNGWVFNCSVEVLMV
jgi:hypothetical protein